MLCYGPVKGTWIFVSQGHGKCRLRRASLFCREYVVIIDKFSRKIRVDITLL